MKIKPNKGPQRRFLACDAFEVLYGGGVGGGKSFALLLDALEQAWHPQYRALLLRKTFPELRELIQRSRELYPLLFPGARYNQTEKQWVFPSGARIEFGYLQTEADLSRYQGQEYTYLGIDELTHFDLYCYEYLKSRVRTSARTLQCYVRATCNPGGRGHAWVRSRFIDPAPPETEIPDPYTGTTRVFIPALLKDNPYLADTDYGRRLLSLPEAERKALLEGDWYAYEGSVFRLIPGIHTMRWSDFFEAHGLTGASAEVKAGVDPAKFVPAGWKLYRALDWGYAKPFACLWFAVDFDNRAWCVKEYYGCARDGHGELRPNDGVRLEAEAVASKIASIEKELGWFGKVLGVADPACWAKGRGDQDGGPSIVEKMTKAGIYFDRGKNDRISGKNELHSRLAYELSESGALVEAPGLIVLEGAAPHLLRTLPALEYDEHIVEDVDSDGEDHAYDALRYFVQSRPWRPSEKKKQPQWLGRQRMGKDRARSAYVA